MSEVLRLVAGGLLAIASSYVGLIVKRRYKKRAEFFEQAKEYFVFFEKEMFYNKTPVPKINEEYERTSSDEFAEFLKACFEGANDKKDKYFLKKEESERLRGALSGLGKSGYEEQKKYVARWKDEMTAFAEKTAAENKKYGGMYFKLCVLLGIAIVIVLA